MKRHLLITAALGLVLVTFAAVVGVTMASPPAGVTPTLLARGAFEDFKVKSVPDSAVDFNVKAKTPVDVVVRSHDYLVGSHTGWHSHPGPVFITVTQGTLTYYLYDDPTCTPRRVSAGGGFVDGASSTLRTRTAASESRRRRGPAGWPGFTVLAPALPGKRGELALCLARLLP